jgi:hypothetical protein
MALEVWSKIDLQHLHGFTIWEPQVFELLEFFEALLMISVHRAQPKYAQVGDAVELPLSDRLRTLLEQCVPKKTKS